MTQQKELHLDTSLLLPVIHLRRSSAAFPVHAHGCYVLGWVSGGTSAMLCANMRHELGSGSALFIAPGTVHGCAGVHALDYYTVHVPVSVMAALSRASGHCGQLPRAASPTLERRPARFLEQILTSGFSEEKLLENLAGFLSRFWPGSPYTDTEPERAAMTGEIQRILEQEYAGPVSNAWLAKRLDVSESTLLRRFTADTGMTPHAYLMNLRVDRARDLLQAGLAPAQTALQTGFCDQSHFSNVFRRYIGVSPGAYAASVRHGSGHSNA